MSPAQKLAAGKGLVGYLRVSSQGQTDGWSLENQERMIRDWAAQQQIPVVAIEVAPDGFESGATAFDDRAGWQAVERHVATGRVGWIAVSAIDRLSRNLMQMADRVRVWDEQDIAIVAPSQGYGHPEGIGKFLLHLWGAMADHERKRLIGRILPGMQARLQAGLPLGTQPLGYRVASDAPLPGQRPRRHLEPDPVTAPIIAALYQQALTHPDWGDRRMAAWAAVQWPATSWSPGRMAKILTNEIYAGVLRAALQGEAVVLLDNHPAIVSAVDFGRVQAIRGQRVGDLQAGINAVHASSWLGGLATCGCCGGTVTWRGFIANTGSGSPVPGGRYVCTGGQRATPDAKPSLGCGAVWAVDIEAFVWRAVQCLLEQEVSALSAIAAGAMDRLPGLLDERRRRAQDDMAAADTDEARLTDDLAEGRLTSEAYTEACHRLAGRRTLATALLQETDGLTYLAKLVLLKDGPEAGRWRVVRIEEAVTQLSLPERRRLLSSLAESFTLEDPARIGSLDGPGEAPEAGRFRGVTVARWAAAGAVSAIALGMARLLVHHPGWDLDAGATAAGLERREGEDGVSWVGEHATITAQSPAKLPT